MAGAQSWPSLIPSLPKNKLSPPVRPVLAGLVGSAARARSRWMGKDGRIRTAGLRRRKSHGDPNYLGEATRRHVGRVRADLPDERHHEGEEHQGPTGPLAVS